MLDGDGMGMECSPPFFFFDMSMDGMITLHYSMVC